MEATAKIQNEVGATIFEAKTDAKNQVAKFLDEQFPKGWKLLQDFTLVKRGDLYFFLIVNDREYYVVRNEPDPKEVKRAEAEYQKACYHRRKEEQKQKNEKIKILLEEKKEAAKKEKEKKRAEQKAVSEKNRKNNKEYLKAYYQKNKEKILEHQKVEYQKKRKKKEPE